MTSAIVVFRSKSKRLNTFLDRANWLLLAAEVRFWALAGTILGTVAAAVDRVGTLADVKAGRTKPARQVFARLRRKHCIPR